LLLSTTGNTEILKLSHSTSIILAGISKKYFHMPNEWETFLQVKLMWNNLFSSAIWLNVANSLELLLSFICGKSLLGNPFLLHTKKLVTIYVLFGSKTL